MKKRILFLALAAVMLLSTISGVCAPVAYAKESEKPSHTHSYKSKVILQPTEAAGGIICYYCICGDYFEEEVPPMPAVYVSKYRNNDDVLCARFTVAQEYKIKDGAIDIRMENWFASQLVDKYNYKWENENVRQRAVEFKAQDVGIGYFNDKVNSYTLKVPVQPLTKCDENGGLVVFLTTGAAMVRLSEDATSALVAQAKETIGVKVSRDGDNLNIDLLVDGKAVEAPNGVEVIYWVKDAKDAEPASDEILESSKYMNFETDGDFDIIYTESLNGIVNCNK